MSEKKTFTVEETLMADTIRATYAPFLIYSEVMEGARRPLIFLEIVREDFSLIGTDGSKIEVPTATQLSAGEDTETNVAAGIGGSTKTIGTISISATAIIYCAADITDSLLEDYPHLDAIRLNLRNMGSAVMEKLDGNIRDVLAAGYGVYNAVANLGFDECIDSLADMEDNSWIPDANNPPFLCVSPQQCAYLVKLTKFVETPRFYGQSPDRLLGEAGLWAGMRVMKTPALKKSGQQSYALIVFPPDYKFGPSIILAWKRRLRVRTERYENKEITYYITTLRAKSEVVQAYGVCRIDITNTP